MKKGNLENCYSDFDLDSNCRSYFARSYELHELKKQLTKHKWVCHSLYPDS